MNEEQDKDRKSTNRRKAASCYDQLLRQLQDAVGKEDSSLCKHQWHFELPLYLQVEKVLFTISEPNRQSGYIDNAYNGITVLVSSYH